MSFILDYCEDSERDYNRLLTLFDLNQMFQRRLGSAIFSLDAADPDMPYHPFNQMRFAPTTLHHSPLLHTMLLTDYLLKFLTVGQEVQRREVVACVDGCEGEIVTAPAPLHVLPKVKATEEFLSFLVVSKLDDRQPLYHLEKQLQERYGIDCSRQTMARWMIELMYPLQPIYNLLKDSVIAYNVASCDATHTLEENLSLLCHNHRLARQ